MAKKKYPKGMSEAEKLALSQKRRAAERAAGVVPLTPSQQRSKDAAGRRKGITSKVVPPSSGYQALLDAMKPKKPKRKKD